MKTLLNALLFATMTCSLAAQRYEPAQLPTADHSSPKEAIVVVRDTAQLPTPIRQADVDSPTDPIADEPSGGDTGRFGPTTDPKLGVTFWGVRDEHLMLKAEATELDTKYLCLVIASVSDTMMNLPGLPPLLMTDTIVASGLNVGSFAFDMGPAKLPFAVFAQAVITDGVQIASSNVLKIEPVK